MKDDRIYIRHILEAIDRIQSYCAEGEERFMGSTLVQDAVIRNFQVIGEASKRISQVSREQFPDADWSAAARMRDKLIHDYEGIDYARVWQTVQESLPPLKSKMEHVLATLS